MTTALERLRRALKAAAPEGVSVTDERTMYYRNEDSAAWAEILVEGPGMHAVFMYANETEELFRRAWTDHTTQLCFVAEDGAWSELPGPLHLELDRLPSLDCAPGLDLADLDLADASTLIHELQHRLPAELDAVIRRFRSGEGDDQTTCHILLVPEHLTVFRLQDPTTRLFAGSSMFANPEMWIIDEVAQTVQVRRKPRPPTLHTEQLRIVGEPGFEVDLAGVFGKDLPSIT